MLQIFDIQGHDRYRKNVPRSFFKGAHGAVVVFDADKAGCLYALRPVDGHPLALVCNTLAWCYLAGALPELLERD